MVLVNIYNRYSSKMSGQHIVLHPPLATPIAIGVLIILNGF